jgi:uncharacterized OB-fold protein
MTRTLPPVTELTEPYWEGCKAGELRLQRCTDCNRHQFYPRTVCSHCNSRQLDWVVAGGGGQVASFTVVRRAISKAYTAPYVVALVDLDEGVRMMSNVVGVDPEMVTVGDRVTVDFEAWSEALSLPVFRLMDSGGKS